MPACRKCGTKFPNRVWVDGIVHSVHHRRYCLSCSPFGTHNTRRLEGPPNKCVNCGENDASKFYGHKRSWCGACHNQYTADLGRQKRERIIALLGGKCVHCGFDTFSCSLDVHHLDTARKDPPWASVRGWAWDRIEKELKSCILLCKNCHAAVHAGLIALNVGA